jgi:excinuclease ABC subunit C
MMAEVVDRRLRRLLNENRSTPDLILVDGGKGQLSAVINILENLGIKDQPIIGLAKRLEEIFKPGIHDAQILPKSSASLYLLQRVRDEAHRFAITYHRKLRGKRISHSLLDEIDGIGEKRRKILLKSYASLDKMRAASVEELASIKGMNRKVATELAQALQKMKSKPAV